MRAIFIYLCFQLLSMSLKNNLHTGNNFYYLKNGFAILSQVIVIIAFIGAGDEDRTRDIKLGKLAFHR